jgi:tRNA(fMet)-specific endonuclease VapC
MTMYCFDTDILAAALLREPPMQLVRRLARTPGDQQCTTAVAVAEIVYAATRNGDQELTTRIRELIAAATTVLPFDHEAAEAYGALRAQLEGVGVRLDEPSLRIAAIALSHDLTLVTASARLYDRVPGLRIENWLEPDDAELEAPADEDDGAVIGTRGAAGVADGIVLHPGLVPSLEARARSAAGTGDPETDEASAEAL